MSKMVYVIAEVGVNHNGSLREAKRLVKAAKNSGSDGVKFQTFKANSLIVKDTEKAIYQRSDQNNESQYHMLKRLELTKNEFRKIKTYADSLNIDFLSSAFDLKSLDFLISLNLKKFKVPSGEITNRPLLKKIGSLNKPTILSTGMSSVKEIKQAISVLCNSGLNKSKLTVLHCNTDYPTDYKDVNLKAMKSIQKDFKVDIGYSDHTLGNEVAIGAVALGAKIIEKHFTLDKTGTGPDHSSSLEPAEFKELVSNIRNIENSLGSLEKIPSKSEMKNLFYVRKSIVALQRIKKGEVFTERNLTCKRPAGGISPMEWDSLIGKKATKDYQPEEYIESLK